MIWKLSRLFPLLAMTVSSFSGFAQQKPLAAIASPGPGRMPPRQLLMLPSVLPPVPLGRKMPSVNLAQYIQGGVPPYTMSMTQTKPSVAKAFLSGTSLSSDYAYHGGTNVITITVTDSVKSKRTSTLMLTVPVPTVVYPLFGIDFSPYEDGQDPNVGSEISVDQLTRSIGLIALYAKNLRSFGVDHGLENFGCIAHKFGLGAWVNAWIGKDLAANETAVQTLIELAERGCVDVAIIGSEVLLRGDVSAAQLIAYIDEFRAAVPNVKVVTADTYGEFETYPSVAGDCDFIFANYYPFWEKTGISLAMSSLNAEDIQLQTAFPGKEIVISETGWPSAGTAQGDATPSLANASYYFLDFESWAQAERRKSFWFEFRDEAWKTAEGDVGPTWGIFDTENNMKYGSDVFRGVTLPDNWSCTALVGGAGTPSITFTTVPPYGSAGSSAILKGTVEHVAPHDYYVAVYILVGSGWWTKPTFAQPESTIQCDGTFITNIDTGGNDPYATQIAAFVMPFSYGAPPQMKGGGALPSDLYTYSVAYLIVSR